VGVPFHFRFKIKAMNKKFMHSTSAHQKYMSEVRPEIRVKIQDIEAQIEAIDVSASTFNKQRVRELRHKKNNLVRWLRQIS
jgi:hypothetical protein